MAESFVHQYLVLSKSVYHEGGMEKLSDLWGKFSLLESEESKYQVRDETLGEEYLVAARFFIGRAISIEAVARTFRWVWQTKKGFKVRDMGNHRVLFAFTNEEDVDRVMQGEPWLFDKQLVALKQLEKNTPI